MKKSKHKAVMVKKNQKQTKNTAAELVQNACLDDYKSCLESYDKIYEKVNIALVFCGIILLVILSSLDYNVILTMFKTESNLEFVFAGLYLKCSVVSIFCIIWSVIKLLLLMRSRDLSVFNSFAAKSEGIYSLSVEDASVWLIDNYTYAVKELRKINDKKQRQYDTVIIIIVVSLLAYAVTNIIDKFI